MKKKSSASPPSDVYNEILKSMDEENKELAESKTQTSEPVKEKPKAKAKAKA